MCGLAAIYAYRDAASPVDEEELTRIRDAMAARGPDGCGQWTADDGRVGLAHRRLAIIDLSDAAAQPMALEDGRHRIVFNGEIYNYQALKDDLEARGERFRTTSDTEVVLRLYRLEGERALEKLRGMYAFAIWDQERRGLFLARDPLGIKPLYYCDDGKTLRVASQVKALLAGGVAGDGWDAAGHVGFHLLGYVPEPHTLHADIRALSAGTSMWVDAGGAREPHPHFSLSPLLADPPAPVPLRDALLDSVRHHLVADVPVGVFLSAGLDSATICALASECAGAGLETVTLAFDEFSGTERDEAPLAETVAAHYGTDHETRRVRGASFHEALLELFAAMDQPTVDGVNVFFVARAARERGLKVALSGLGGDELFAGYDTFRQAPKLARILGWVPGMKAMGRAFRVASAGAAARLASPKYAGLFEYGTTLEDAYLLRRGLFTPWELADILDGDMLRDGLRELDVARRMRADFAGVQTDRRKTTALEAGWYMRGQLLRDADWAGMAHSLEIRTPLVDETLWRSVAALDASKADMAATPATPLPDAVLNRAKTGFFVPVREWLEGETGGGARGLRGWARRVYGAALNREAPDAGGSFRSLVS